MKTLREQECPPRPNAPPGMNSPVVWPIHISWLHRSVPQTKASRTKIERWRKQLDYVSKRRNH